MMNGAAGRIVEWVGPHVPEASDGILTSAGICEGLAGAGVDSSVLIFGGFAGLVAGTLAMGAVSVGFAQDKTDDTSKKEGKKKGKKKDDKKDESK